MILLDVIAVAASVCSVALAAAAVSAWVSRPKRGVAACHGHLLTVCGAAGPGSLESSTVRALAASAGAIGASLVAGHLRDDAATPAVLEAVRREFSSFNASSVAAVTDSRKNIEPSLVAAALAAGDGDPVMIIGPWSRPSARAIRDLASCQPGTGVVSAIPGRTGGAGGMFSLQADLVRLTPVLYSLFGPRGVVPTVSLVSRRTVFAALGDPLSLNMLSAGAALHASGTRESFVPAGVSVAFGDQVATAHLATLSRVGRLRYAAACLALSASPLALAAVLAGLIFGTGPTPTALSALFASVCARAAALMTWRAESDGAPARLLDAALSPLADVPALVRAIAAASSRVVIFGRVRYALHGNGLLSPTPDRGDESGGRP